MAYIHTAGQEVIAQGIGAFFACMAFCLHGIATPVACGGNPIAQAHVDGIAIIAKMVNMLIFTHIGHQSDTLSIEQITRCFN